MRLSDLQRDRVRDVLGRCEAWTRTQQYMRRLEEARRAIGLWLDAVDRPAVSVSGGKDSTLLLALVREQHPECPAYRADPPNPLPGRKGHVETLQREAGGPWVIVPYPWDVDAVLRGDVPYPARLKIRRLEEAHRRDGVDGVALGVRAAESRTRTAHVAQRGLVYVKSDGTTVCQPLARWSAEMVIGGVLGSGLPLHPVYRRLACAGPSLERLREGTWWPVHQDQRRWIEANYPSVLGLHDRARAVMGGAVDLQEWG